TTAANNYTIGVSYNWVNTGGIFTANASTVSFNGTTAGHTIKSNGSPFGNVQVNGAGGYWTLIDSMTLTSTMTLTAGTLDTASQAILSMGNWTNNSGTFKANQSTITFAGGAAQTFNELSTTTFNMLVDSNTSSGGVTFASSFTASGLTVNGAALASATTVYFQANSTFTITTLSLQGASGQVVTVRSTTPGTYTYLNNTTVNNVSYVSVQDNNASAGIVISAGSTSQNAGHTLNWSFSPNWYNPSWLYRTQ